MSTCLCSHPEPDHGTRGPRPCDRNLHPACGCGSLRPDLRVRDGDETSAATENGPPRCICPRFTDTGDSASRISAARCTASTGN